MGFGGTGLKTQKLLQILFRIADPAQFQVQFALLQQGIKVFRIALQCSG